MKTREFKGAEVWSWSGGGTVEKQMVMYYVSIWLTGRCIFRRAWKQCSSLGKPVVTYTLFIGYGWTACYLLSSSCPWHMVAGKWLASNCQKYWTGKHFHWKLWTFPMHVLESWDQASLVLVFVQEPLKTVLQLKEQRSSTAEVTRLSASSCFLFVLYTLPPPSDRHSRYL